MTNPLQSLISDDSYAEILAEILGPYLQFSKQGDLRFLPAFTELSSRSKVLIVLAGLCAKVTLFNSDKKEMKAFPGMVARLAGIPEGTAKPLLAKLYNERRINKDKEGYFLESHGIQLLKKEINHKKNA